MPPHRHEVYHFILFTQGRDVFQLHEEQYEFAPGLVAVSSPGELHRFGPFRSASTTAYREITFSLVTADQQPLMLPFTDLLSKITGLEIPATTWPRRFTDDQTREIESALRKIQVERSNLNAFGQWQLRRAIVSFFALLAEEVLRPAESDRLASPLLNARQHIEQHFSAPLQVADLAEIAQLSPAHFARCFAREFGQTPNAMLVERRIQAARDMLRYTDSTLPEIAERCGFNDLAYFSRTFKKHTNEPPAHYRKQHWKGANHNASSVRGEPANSG